MPGELPRPRSCLMTPGLGAGGELPRDGGPGERIWWPSGCLPAPQGPQHRGHRMVTVQQPQASQARGHTRDCSLLPSKSGRPPGAPSKWGVSAFEPGFRLPLPEPLNVPQGERFPRREADLGRNQAMSRLEVLEHFGGAASARGPRRMSAHLPQPDSCSPQLHCPLLQVVAHGASWGLYQRKALERPNLLAHRPLVRPQPASCPPGLGHW